MTCGKDGINDDRGGCRHESCLLSAGLVDWCVACTVLGTVRSSNPAL